MAWRLDLYHHLAGVRVLDDILADLATHRIILDRLRRQEETLMATTTRLEAAVAQILALVTALKGTQENPATQATLDTLAAQLEEAAAPPAG